MRRGHARNLRNGRWSEPAGIYFVTFATFDRRRLFDHWEFAQAGARCLADRATWSDARLLSWVLMPDHFHDRAIRRADDVRAAARYLVANPLRAGLVEHIGDYPYWNAVWLTDDTPV